MSVLSAVQAGDERRTLVEMRDTVAEAIDDGPAPRDLAALTKRLMELCADIRDFDAREKARADERARSEGEEDEVFDPEEFEPETG